MMVDYFFMVREEDVCYTRDDKEGCQAEKGGGDGLVWLATGIDDIEGAGC
jgi:hypothetical protein